LTDKQRKYLKSSLECSLRLWSYIDNMLDVMKLQAGKYPVRISPTRICEIAKSVVADQKVKAKECRVTLKNDMPKDLPRVAADFELIHRVLDNLVSNALKFTSPKGRIEISARVDGGFVRVEVKDTGAGIPKEKLEKIFEDFFQVDETREQSKERGTGLGLAICARIVREHGGRIWAESRLGEGTRFYFTLPAAGEEA
jgi:signal transduction histidine kinase